MNGFELLIFSENEYIYTDPILVFPKTDTKSYNMSAKQLRLTVEANLVPGKT
jgi:hypothetical protein